MSGARIMPPNPLKINRSSFPCGFHAARGNDATTAREQNPKPSPVEVLPQLRQRSATASLTVRPSSVIPNPPPLKPVSAHERPQMTLALWWLGETKRCPTPMSGGFKKVVK